MAFTNEGKNVMLSAITAEIDFVTIYDEDGEEILDTDGNMQRQEVSWDDPVDGEVYASNEPEFSIPEDTSVDAVGFFDLADETEGTQLALDGSISLEEYANEGLYRLTQIRLEIKDEQTT